MGRRSGEMVIAEAGAMLYLSSGNKLETVRGPKNLPRLATAGRDG
ncbi:MAG: hypothetical protein WD872_00655 [Pirellulaceae bacterium]